MSGIGMRHLGVMMIVPWLALATASASAQGGPPMLTDDPGTPGDGKWEINIAATYDHAGDATTYRLPLIDANYGVGERIQLKFEMPWQIDHVAGEPRKSGAGNSSAGVKWRFFDAGEDGWQISMYPQVQSRFPVSGSPVAESGVSYLLPLEFQHKLGGDWSVNFDAGRWFRPRGRNDAWIGGVALGREFSEKFEMIGELHDEYEVGSGRNEVTFNLGARWKFSDRYTLLASAGRDVHNGLEDRSTLLAYLGLQINL